MATGRALRLAKRVLLPLSLLATTFASILWVTAGSILRPEIYRPGTPGGALPALAAGGGSDEVAGAPSDARASQADDPQRALGLAFEDVAFFTEGGATLRGWLVPAVPPAKRAIVLVHGAWRDRREMLDRVPWLHAAGLDVLLFDLREHGTSDGSGRGPSFGPRESADVAAAARFLRAERGHARVALFGHGLGAAAAVLAAASAPGIADAVISESAPARFFDLPAVPAAFVQGIVSFVDLRGGVSGERIDPQDVVARLAPAPLLVLHGTADATTPSLHARRLFDAAREPRTLWLIPGGNADRPGEAAPEEYAARVAGLLATMAE